MKCKKCGACCRVWGIVEVTNADKAKIPKSMYQKCELYPHGLMMKTYGFTCTALSQDNRCRIYGRRPSVCHRFKPGSLLCCMAREQDRKTRRET